MPEDINTSDELTRVFGNGTVFNSSDKDLDKYLAHLCSGYVLNENVRHREMNRCQVINSIKTFRFINSIERTNKIFTIIIIILTLATMALSFYSIRLTSESSTNTERLISIHEKHLSEQQLQFETRLKQQEVSYESAVSSQKLFIEAMISRMNSNNAVKAPPPEVEAP